VVVDSTDDGKKIWFFFEEGYICLNIITVVNWRVTMITFLQPRVSKKKHT